MVILESFLAVLGIVSVIFGITWALRGKRRHKNGNIPFVICRFHLHLVAKIALKMLLKCNLQRNFQLSVKNNQRLYLFCFVVVVAVIVVVVKENRVTAHMQMQSEKLTTHILLHIEQFTQLLN